MTHRTEILGKLADTVSQRGRDSSETSYTARLLSEGMEKCAKKFGEEAVELALAAMTQDRQHVTSEAADVLYHLIVLLEAANVPVSQVMAELERRQAQGGLAEKASRR